MHKEEVIQNLLSWKGKNLRELQVFTCESFIMFPLLANLRAYVSLFSFL